MSKSVTRLKPVKKLALSQRAYQRGSQILAAVNKLYDDKRRWLRGDWMNNDGTKVCASQALSYVGQRSSGAVRERARNSLTEALGGHDIISVNDGPQGFRRIRKALRKAIQVERARERGA